MNGWRGRAADIFTDQGARAAKMKSAPGPGTTDLGYSTTPHPTKGVRPRARCLDATSRPPRRGKTSRRSSPLREINDTVTRKDV